MNENSCEKTLVIVTHRNEEQLEDSSINDLCSTVIKNVNNKNGGPNASSQLIKAKLSQNKNNKSKTLIQNNNKKDDRK